MNSFVLVDLSKFKEKLVQAEAMNSDTPISNTEFFARYAGDNNDRWLEINGRQVTHNRLGKGVIVGIGACIYVRFEKETKKFERKKFKYYFCDVEISQCVEMFREDIRKLVQLEEQQKAEEEKYRAEEQRKLVQLEEQRRAEEQRHREEVQKQKVREKESAREFAALKLKYFAQSYTESSPASLLYVILLKLDAGESLDEIDLQELKNNGLFGAIAIFSEKEFQKSGNLWSLIKASSCWRDEGKPERAIKLTANVHTTDSKLMSALLTTRGGAFRDTNALTEAEQCATAAIEYNSKSHHPHSLLGAIYYESGDPTKGDEHFDIAQKLGAKANAQEFVLKSTIERAGKDNKVIIANYLLRKDPQKYKWVKHYLQSEDIQR
ncbi:MAG: hypothetical protein WBG73_02720 [Coleofasciculaceae cyanobacterium]